MRQITIRFGGVGTQKWIVDQDTVLVGVAGLKQFVISNDQNMSVVAWNNPPIAGAILDQLNISNDANTQLMGNLAFPLEKNQELYVSCASAGNVQLYLEDSIV